MFSFETYILSFMFRVAVLLEGKLQSHSEVYCRLQQVFFPKLLLYFTPSSVSSAPTIFHIPAEEKQPLNTMLPPQCLTVSVYGNVQCYFYFTTYMLPIRPEHLLPRVCCGSQVIANGTFFCL